MTTLEIKFTNDLTFKYVHDLIIEHNPNLIRFIELDDIQNIEHIFEIAHILDLFNYKSEYVTYRDTFQQKWLVLIHFLEDYHLKILF